MLSKLVSICIPTNGITEWLFPAVNSIFEQGVDDELFEVVITDNGSSDECYEDIINEFGFHSNIVYKKTDDELFTNMLTGFSLAQGLFIKFMNHRALMKKGTLNYLLDFVRKYEKALNKPVIYYDQSGGLQNNGCLVLDSFDEFVRELSYNSSYSGGLAFWRDDFRKIPDNHEYNYLFPQTDIIFAITDRKQYIIDRNCLFDYVKADHSQKGQYNLFFAFGVEYPSIILRLARNGSISFDTFESVRNANEKFLISCYRDFVLLDIPHSYDLDNAEQYINVFYSFPTIKKKALKKIPVQILEEEKLKKLKGSKKVFIFGAGTYARRWIYYLRDNKIDIAGIIVSDKKNNPDEIFGIKVLKMSEFQLNYASSSIVIPGIKNKEEIVEMLKQKHFEVFDEG